MKKVYKIEMTMFPNDEKFKKTVILDTPFHSKEMAESTAADVFENSEITIYKVVEVV